MTIRPPAFVFHNGRSARNAADLLLVLEEGPIDLWSDHVVPAGPGAEPRNDFASWAEHGLHEKALAAHLRAARTREETIATLKRWLEPHIARSANLHGAGAREFFFGLAAGIVIGIVIMTFVALA